MRKIGALAIGGFLALFLVLPLLSLFLVSFTGEPVNLLGGHLSASSWSLRYYSEFFQLPRYYKGLVNSVLLSTAVTLASCVLGVFVALVLGRTAVPARAWLRALALVPLALPSYLMAVSFIFLFGKSGLVTHLTGIHLDPFTPLGTLLVQTFSFFPVVMLTTAASLEQLDPSVEEAAGVTGGNPVLIYWKIVLPLLTPGVMAGAFLTFIRSFGDFAAPMLLMPPSIKLIVLEAYRDMSGNTYWGGAATLSVIMVVTVVAVMALQRRYLDRHKFETIGGRSVGAPRLYRGVSGCRILFLLTLLLLAFPLVNVVVLVLLSLSASWGSDQLFPTLTFDNYRMAVGSSLHFVTSGLFLSLVAVFFCLILGTCVAWILYRTRWWGKHLLDTLVLIPFILPGTAFAIALVTAFNQPPLALHLTAELVIIAYIVTRTPYAVRSVTASLSQIGPSMEEASSTMGGTGSLTALKVLLPMVRPGLLAGGIMAFISCMTDVAITLMVCPPDWYPVSVTIYLQTAESKYFLAAAYGIVLMVFVFGAYTAMLRLGKTRELAT